MFQVSAVLMTSAVVVQKHKGTGTGGLLGTWQGWEVPSSPHGDAPSHRLPSEDVSLLITGDVYFFAASEPVKEVP